MATLAHNRAPTIRGERFFMISAILMALVPVCGFSFQLAMGRSSFASPWYVHTHALLFFGWTSLYLLQNTLVATGALPLHRRLGWLAVAWIPAMVVAGLIVTVAIVRRGSAPFFFTPLYFLVMDSLALLSFAGLATSAILKRRQTPWHSRLMFCGMAVLTGPGFGRLLPLPFLIPYAGWAVFGAIMLFPLAGIIRDLKQSGRVHPAWWWGVAVISGAQISMDLITNSPVGLALYQAVTQGSPGATTDPRGYPPPPWLAKR
jgi:hypothetical protein